jgi:uncharacterized protein (DUF427 family)
MTRITIKKIETGEIIAEGVVGDNSIEFEGNYYFDRSDVNLENSEIRENAYHCPTKLSDCDYYFLRNQAGKSYYKEFAWVYPKITNSLFAQIEGKIGFYPKGNSNSGVDVTIENKSY